MFINLSELKNFFPTYVPTIFFPLPFILLFLSQFINMINKRVVSTRFENARIATFFNDLLEEERCLIYSLCCYSVVYRSHFFDANVPNGCSPAFYSLIECEAKDFEVAKSIVEYTFISEREGIYYAFRIDNDFLEKLRSEFTRMYEDYMTKQGKIARYVLYK